MKHGLLCPPHRRAAALAAVAAVLAFTLESRAVNPLLVSRYDASEDRTLGTSKLGDIKEADFFCFLVMRDDPAPDMLERYLTEPDYRKRQRAREVLHQALEDYLIVMGASRIPLRLRYSDPALMRMKPEEFVILPLYDLVWTDRVVRKEIELSDMDLRKFYKDQASLFTRPATVTARVIFRGLDENVDPREISRQEQLLEDLRRRAVAGEDFSRLARDYSQAPSARDGGRIPPTIEGTTFAEFDNAVGALTAGGLSEPFQGPGGMYLVKVEDRREATLPPFEEVKEEVRRELEKKVLRYRYVAMLDRLTASPRGAWRPEAFETGADDDWLVEAGHFKLTISDLVRLVPSVIREDCFADAALARGVTRRIFTNLLIREDLLDKGVHDDPRLERARRVAPNVVGASRVMSERMLEYAKPTTDTLKGFMREKASLFVAPRKCAFIKIVATAKAPEKGTLRPLERLQRTADAKESLRPYLERYAERLRTIDRAAAAGGRQENREKQRIDTLFETLKEFDRERYDLNATGTNGYFDDAELKKMAGVESVSEIEPYRVYGPMKDDETATFWVCAAVEEPVRPAFEEVAGVVLAQYQRSVAERARRSVLQEVLPLAEVAWTYDRLPYKPRPPRAGAVAHNPETSAKWPLDGRGEFPSLTPGQKLAWTRSPRNS